MPDHHGAKRAKPEAPAAHGYNATHTLGKIKPVLLARIRVFRDKRY